MRQPIVQDGTSVKLQGQGQGRGLDVRGQGQGQGLDVQGQGQGQGLQKVSSRRLEAKAVASRTSSLLMSLSAAVN